MSLLVTLGLFYLTASILYQESELNQEDTSVILADFRMPERNIETISKVKKPEKPQQRTEPTIELPQFQIPGADSTIEKMQLDMPTIDTDIKLSMTMPEASSDSDYVAVLKVAPLYPQRAANRKIEGYVVVEYSISAAGQVSNVKVIDAKPTGVFEKSAIEAAKRFKYKPRKVNGKHVNVDGVKNKFTFILENQ